MSIRLGQSWAGPKSAWGLVAAGYAVLAHVVMSQGDATRAAAAFALLPLAGACLLLAWHTRWRWVAAGAAAALLAGPVLLWPPRGLDLSAVYLAQYSACQLALAALFGRTLAPERQPLVTRLASSVHGALPPPIERYTRTVTLAWTLFFVAMAASAILLYCFASRAAWSLFVNLLTLPCVAVMFAVEYCVRRMRYPWFAHASLIAGVLAFRQGFRRRNA